MTEEWTLFDLENSRSLETVGHPLAVKSDLPENLLSEENSEKASLPANIDKLTKLFIHPVREGCGETVGRPTVSNRPTVSDRRVDYLWAVVCLECDDRWTFTYQIDADDWCLKHRKASKDSWDEKRRPFTASHYVTQPFVVYVRKSTTDPMMGV